MNKLSGLGIITALAGFVLIIFKMIASATNKSFAIADLTIAGTLSDADLEQIDNIQNGIIHTCADSIVTTPLYLYLIIVGILILIAGGLTAK